MSLGLAVGWAIRNDPCVGEESEAALGADLGVDRLTARAALEPIAGSRAPVLGPDGVGQAGGVDDGATCVGVKC